MKDGVPTNLGRHMTDGEIIGWYFRARRLAGSKAECLEWAAELLEDDEAGRRFILSILKRFTDEDVD